MTALSTAYFLVSCKGALHPIDYDGNFLESCSVRPLSFLCCELLARDPTLLKKICTFLPTQIYCLLMTTAIRKGYNSSVAVLLPTWPTSTISAKKLWPQLLDNFRVIYDHKYRNDRVKTAVNVTTTLLHSFLTVVRNDSSSFLDTLDLRGLPTTDHVIRNLTREMSSQSFGELRSREYHLYVDCSIRDEDTCSELSSILTFVRNSTNTKFRVHINKLDVSCIGGEKLKELLQNTDRTELDGLSIQYNSLGNAGFQEFVLPVLGEFLWLSALDVSCNNLFSVTNAEHDLRVLREFQFVCERLRFLLRLDLSNNRLTNNLHNVLSWHGVDRLEYLNLSACTLSDNDLRYLSSIPLRLCELDLSENSSVSRRLDVLSVLLRSLSSTLRILELEDCKLDDDRFPSLVAAVLPLVNVRYLNLCHHRLGWTSLHDCFSSLGVMKQLECIKMSYPRECYRMDANELDAVARDRICAQLELQLASKKSPLIGIKWTELF